MNEVPEGYKRDAVGALHPLDTIKPINLIRDELVKKLVDRGSEINAMLKKYKEESLAEIAAFVSLAADVHGVKIGGKKGNVCLVSFDGEYKVLRANHDCISFNEQLLAAKELIDQCLQDWSGRPGVPKGLVVIANKAFRRNSKGEISVARVMDLRTHDIDDERWVKAMNIIADSIQVSASVTYLRLQKRLGKTDQYQPISLDIAGV